MTERLQDIKQYSKEDILAPRIEMADIFAVQALAMGSIRGRARTQLRKPEKKLLGFCVTDSGGGGMSPEEFYDGTEQSTLACTVRKLSYGQWRMRVRFVSWVLREELNQTTIAEMYSFDWDKQGNRIAWAYAELHTSPEPGVAVIQQSNIRPLGHNECLDLQYRMRTIGGAANAFAATDLPKIA